MIEGGRCLGLQLKAAETLRIARPEGREHLDGHVAFQGCVAGAIGLAHTTCTQGGDDLIRIYPGASDEWHSRVESYLSSCTRTAPARLVYCRLTHLGTVQYRVAIDLERTPEPSRRAHAEDVMGCGDFFVSTQSRRL